MNRWLKIGLITILILLGVMIFLVVNNLNNYGATCSIKTPCYQRSLQTGNIIKITGPESEQELPGTEGKNPCDVVSLWEKITTCWL